MKVHIIGHASLLIEADGVTMLMDPVFWDPNYEGTNAMCPQREVTLEKLPPYDVVAVSHRHLDHFDVRTLASLNRRCRVVIPDADPLLESAIRRLGFAQVSPLRDGQSIEIGGTSLTTTPSKANVREFGVIVRDATATLWNQVDSYIDAAIACAIAEKFGPIDLLLATWQPLLEGEALTNGTTSFPYETYFRMVSNVKLIRPRAVVPSACGFKFTGVGAWLNKFVFPATREMFLRDVAAVAPNAGGFAANPGDVIEVSRNCGASVDRCASPFVRMVRDDLADTAFDPTGAVPELTDPNPRGCAERETLGAIQRFFETAMLPALAASARRGRIACEYQELGIVYQLDVVFPSGIRSWSLDFGAGISMAEGESRTAHIRSRIAASALADLIAGRCSPNYVYGAGLYRSSQRVYSAEPRGIYRWQPISERSVADPLWLALDPEALFEQYVDREVSDYERCKS